MNLIGIKPKPIPINPADLLRPLTREEEVMYAVLDAAGIYREERSMVMDEAKIKLGICKRFPCEFEGSEK